MPKEYSSMAPKDFNDPGRETLTQADTGNLGLALLALTKEVWVISDRLAVMEAVLAEKGIDIREEIESYQPNPEMKQALRARGDKLVSSVLNTLGNLPTDPQQD